MQKLGFRTAGESHGQALVATLEGIPAGLTLDVAAVDRMLVRRQGGHGRSGRQAIEADAVEILTGLKRGRTLGSPLTLVVRNRDVRIDTYRKLARPRPGHADLAGAIKYGTDDVSDIMERASARETAARVAAGAVAAQVLAAVGVDVFGWVTSIGAVQLGGSPTGADRVIIRDISRLYSLDPEGDVAASALIDALREAGDTVGGTVAVVATGMPAGLGSHLQWDRRLDGRLGQALLSIPAVKAVGLGAGAAAATTTGLDFHDAIRPDGAGGVGRPTNRAGGIEGGLTNGEPVVVHATMKPLPTVKRPLPTVDLTTGEAAEAVYERSDVCAVPACSVVAEAMVALTVLDALLDTAEADTMDLLVAAVARLRARGAVPVRRP